MAGREPKEYPLTEWAAQLADGPTESHARAARALGRAIAGALGENVGRRRGGEAALEETLRGALRACLAWEEPTGADLLPDEAPAALGIGAMTLELVEAAPEKSNMEVESLTVDADPVEDSSLGQLPGDEEAQELLPELAEEGGFDHQESGSPVELSFEADPVETPVPDVPPSVEMGDEPSSDYQVSELPVESSVEGRIPEVNLDDLLAQFGNGGDQPAAARIDEPVYQDPAPLHAPVEVTETPALTIETEGSSHSDPESHGSAEQLARLTLLIGEAPAPRPNPVKAMLSRFRRAA